MPKNKKLLKKIRFELNNNKLTYLILGGLLFICFFLRIYRIDQLLGFYYDQGRDALVIWDLWHKGKLFLIGPTTGIEGIYRGPWYYWLIAPFYLVGGGNPIWPSAFLSFTTVLASFFAFLIGKRIGGNLTGLIASVLFAFSFNLVLASRWLSNPTPMLLISMLLIFSIFNILDGKKVWWVATSVLLGLAMQFGSAAEVFYFLAVGIIVLLNRKILPDLKIGVISLISIFLVFLPQIYFDLKHDHILLQAIQKFLVTDKSFNLSFWQMVQIRFPFYYDVFFAKLFVGNALWRYYFSIILGVLLVLSGNSLIRNKHFLIVCLFLLSSIFGMLFFQGNHGNVYDYYFTGYYLIFIVFIASILGIFTKNYAGKIIVLAMLSWVFFDNIPILKNYLVSGVDGPNNISLGNQVQAVDWVFNDSRGQEFNQDAYVPPVIPYTYNYLFLWRGNSRCGNNLCNLKLDEQVPLLYTLYEVDPPHPERLDAWLARQRGIGKVEKSIKFGGITVERRVRLSEIKKL